MGSSNKIDDRHYREKHPDGQAQVDDSENRDLLSRRQLRSEQTSPVQIEDDDSVRPQDGKKMEDYTLNLAIEFKQEYLLCFPGRLNDI